jgi:hypothetical protein
MTNKTNTDQLIDTPVQINWPEPNPYLLSKIRQKGQFDETFWKVEAKY